LARSGYHINRSNLLVLESKADMQKRGQASPDDGDALALTFAQPVAPAEVEEEDDEEEFSGYGGHSSSGLLPLNTSEFGDFAATICSGDVVEGRPSPVFAFHAMESRILGLQNH
jgi:hypothetical protein